MAPKASRKASQAHPNSSVIVQGNAKKRPASVSVQSEKSIRRKKCNCIISALAGVGELPPKIRETLSDLVRHSLGLENGLPPQYRDAALTMVREALVSTEKRLEDELRRAKSKVDGAQEDKVAREVAVTDAEGHVKDLHKTIQDSRLAIKESSTSIGTSRKSLKALQTVQKSSQENLHALATKVQHLQDVEQDSYQPLKESSAQGRKGHEQLKCIQKLGKDFGFQEALLESIPGVLKRSLDKRRTFDGLVMSQLEREFIKSYADLEIRLNEGGKEHLDHTQAVQEAKALLDESGKALEESNHRLGEAVAGLPSSKKALTEARQKARRFESDLQKHARHLADAQGRLEAFRSGPLATFQELQKQTSDLPVAVHERKTGVVPSETGSPLLSETLAQPTVSHEALES